MLLAAVGLAGTLPAGLVVWCEGADHRGIELADAGLHCDADALRSFTASYRNESLSVAKLTSQKNDYCVDTAVASVADETVPRIDRGDGDPALLGPDMSVLLHDFPWSGELPGAGADRHGALTSDTHLLARAAVVQSTVLRV